MPVIPENVRWMIVTYVQEGIGCRKIQQRLMEVTNVLYDKSTICKIIRKWREHGTVTNMFGEKEKTARTEANIAAVREELDKDILLRSPKRTPKRLGMQLGISRSSVRRIIKFDLNKRPFKKVYAQRLTANHKQSRLERCAALLRNFSDAQVKRIVFTDETVFTLDGYHNRQNQRVYATRRNEIQWHEIIHARDKFPSNLLVWCGVCYAGKLPIIFLPEGTTLNAVNYRELILIPSIDAANQINQYRNWVWQQDSAPCHRALVNQNYLQLHTPAFIDCNSWPPNSPDCSVMDYGIFATLKEKVYSNHKISNIEQLQQAITSEWRRFPNHIIHNAIDGWRRRLTAIVQNQGGYFEFKDK